VHVTMTSGPAGAAVLLQVPWLGSAKLQVRALFSDSWQSVQDHLSVSRTQKGARCRQGPLMRCCVDDGGWWPSGAALQGEASNHLMLRWLKTVVVSDEEKAPGEASGGGQEDDHC
jgi:hypothetical protein